VPEVVAVFDPVKVVGNSTAHCVFRFIITVRMQNAPPYFRVGPRMSMALLSNDFYPWWE
jgi:hypothetical protein